jgi:GntR family transcriptional regulator/MocR family aminotransferase
MNMLPRLVRDTSMPLQDQLFEHLRKLISAGKLKPNSRVIATRFLAEQIGISRTTVLLAYEKLISEGYLETRPAVGTFVSPSPPDNLQQTTSLPPAAEMPRQASLHPALLRLPSSAHPVKRAGDIDFRRAAQDVSPSALPKIWMKEIREAFARNPNGFVPSQLIAGIPSLRRSVSDYLAQTRGIQAAPEQVIIVAGQRQVCSLVAHLFQRAGDRVVVESPGNIDVSHFFQARGAELVHVPVDESGLETDRLPCERVALAYVSPTRQDPIGAIMPHSRRAALIQWARDVGAYLIEDDSGIEPHYQGIMPPPVVTIDPFGLTFYSGSLARVLGAALTLHYLVVPPEFIEPILAMKSVTDGGCSWLEQVIMADLLSRGIYDQQLRRFRKNCLERRDCLIQALQTHFGEVRLIGTEGGTQLTWLLPDYLRSARAVCEVALMHGVNIESAVSESLSPERQSYLHDRALILSYAALSPRELQQGVELLAKAITL